MEGRKKMNSEVEEIKKLVCSKIDEHISFMKRQFDEETSLLEYELQIKKNLNEYGLILFEKMFPIVFGDGYYGSKVEEWNEEEQENDTYSCMLRSAKRQLKTLFGKADIYRSVYQYDQEGSSISLLDRKLDIHRHKISPAVRYYADLLGITTSYSEGEDLFKRFTATSISERDIDRFTESKAQEIVKKFSKRIEDIHLKDNNVISPALINTDEKHEKIIYLETDGCHVPTRKRHSKDTDWKECKTLLLFEMEEKEIQKEDRRVKVAQVINKRYFSAVSRINYFKKQVKCELEKYCKGEKVKIVCIGDGASWIWKMIKELVPKGRIEILDWYHVKERITLLAADLFSKSNQESDKELFIDELKGYFYNGEFNKGIELLK
jgi:hypothetical protein